MENNVRWTWADLVSSYRFWGLVFLVLLTLVSGYSMIFFKNALFRYHNSVNLSFIYSLDQVSIFLSIIPAWIASRNKSCQSLELFIAIMLSSGLVIYFFSENLLLSLCCFFLIGIMNGAVVLYVSAVIAKALNSVQFFALVFALFSMIKFTAGVSSPFLISTFMNYNEINYNFILICILLILISSLFLLFIKKSLFNEAPPIRKVQCSIKKQHNAIEVFFLSICIPFYMIYWCVRAHRDIRNYSQSAKLLTPTAAGWCAALVPFAMPIMLVSLTDVADESLSKNKSSRWGLILLSFFLLPVAVAIVQSHLNQLPNNTEV